MPEHIEQQAGDSSIQIGQAQNVTIYQGSQRPIPIQRPPRAMHFTDRKQELAHLLQEVQPGHVVTLCGPGGIGKSALAAEVVWQVEPDRFPDGVIFHSFYGQPDPNLALEHIARSFGVDPQPTPASAALQALAGKCALLMLDGTEETTNLAAILDIRGECGVIITSRKRQDALTAPQDVLPLPTSEAVKLLSAWSSNRTEVETATQICVLLGGLPLAIRIVGHYLQTTGEPTAEYLTWLQNQPLEALDQGTHRIESVNVLLTRSLTHVSAEAHQTLAVFGVLAFAPVNREMLMAALPGMQLRRPLNELINYGLLLRDGECYTLSHALIHTYIRERCSAPMEVVERLAAFYTAFAHEQSKQKLAGYARLDAERVHIMRVLEMCKAQAQWKAVSTLVKAVWKYLDIRGYWMEYQSALEMNLIAAQKQGDRQDEGWCVNELGLTCNNRGEYRKALIYCEQSLAIWRELGDKVKEGNTFNNFSQIYHNQGDYTTALGCLEQSLSIAREIGDKSSEAPILNNLGLIYEARGDYATALTCWELALTSWRKIRDKEGEGKTLNNIGQIYDNLGDHAKASTYWEQSLAISRETGDKAGEAVTISNLATISYTLGDYATTLTYLERSLLIQREISDKSGQSTTLNNISKTYEAMRDYTTALTYLEQSLAISREIGDKRGEGTFLNNMGQLFKIREDYATALTCSKQSLAIRREIGDKAGEGRTLNNLSEIYEAMGDYTTALTYLKQSLIISREMGDRKGEGMILNKLGQTFKACGDYTTALQYLEQGLVIIHENGDKEEEGTLLNNLGLIYRKQGDYATALTYLERSSAIAHELGNKTGENVTLKNLAAIAYDSDDYTRTLTYLEQSLAIQREIEDKSEEGKTLNKIGQIYSHWKDYAVALKYFEQSFTIQHEIGDKAGEGMALNNLAITTTYAGGDYTTVLGYLGQSLAIMREIGNKDGEATTLTNIGVILHTANLRDEARKCFQQALSIFEVIGSPNTDAVRKWLVAAENPTAPECDRATLQAL